MNTWMKKRRAIVFAIGVLSLTALAVAQDPATDAPPAAAPTSTEPDLVDDAVVPAAAEQADANSSDRSATASPLPGLIALTPQGKAWIDRERKLVIVDGSVALRRGTLEMFACPKQTKEHESVVAVDVPASIVHAALIAVGAQPGTPVKFRPEYQPPTGTEVDIWVLWRDKEGKPQKTRAQKWVRDVRTGKAMESPWVFAGSGFWVDETGQRRYHGDSGDFICVSNFPTATLDIPVESTQADDALLFEAFTENIPATGTRVRLVLAPKLKP